MDDLYRRTFLAHSTLPAYLARVAEAREIIRAALATHRRPYVAFSGGKDSTAMLALVLEQAPDVMVLHWDYGPKFAPRTMEQTILENAHHLGAIDLRVVTSPKYLDPHHTGCVFGVDFFKIEVPKLLKQGFDLNFVGLRREESGKRRRRIDSGNFLTRMDECWPVLNWSWIDVWAYIVAHDLPYPEFYDRRAPVLGWDVCRMGTLFDKQFMSVQIDGFFDWRHRHAGSR